MEGLKDKVIVFAGAGGIADATATFLGKGGARIVVGDIIQQNAERCVSAVKESGGDGIATQLELSDEESIKALIDLAVKTYGRIDGLFNVAANIHPDEIAKDTNPVDIQLSDWQRTIDVNLTGYMLTCKYAIPHIIASGGGSIVNTISDAVYVAMPFNVAYAATKAGVGALTRNIAAKFGKQGVRSNTVSPGMVLTKNGHDLTAHLEEAHLQMLPSPRLGKPEDIGAYVAFLLSDLGEWINGQSLSINGGSVIKV